MLELSIETSDSFAVASRRSNNVVMHTNQSTTASDSHGGGSALSRDLAVVVTVLGAVRCFVCWFWVHRFVVDNLFLSPFDFSLSSRRRAPASAPNGCIKNQMKIFGVRIKKCIPLKCSFIQYHPSSNPMVVLIYVSFLSFVVLMYGLFFLFFCNPFLVLVLVSS